MTSPVVVSVVMPCYNVERTLKAAVESVLDQSFKNFELLLVNDGATDSTPALCENLAAEDARIRTVHQSNRGLAGARNRGISEAKGNYIALLDADDLFVTAKLAKHVAHLNANPNVGVSFSYSQFMRDDGAAMRMVQGGKWRDISAKDVLCRNPVGNGSAAVIRRAALQDIAPPSGRSGAYFDEALRQSEDVEFWFRFVTTSRWQIEGIPEPLTRYRLNSNGLSADTRSQLQTWEHFLEKASTYAPNEVHQHAARARAYQYRYLARRCVQSGQISMARGFITDGLKADWRMLIEEPVRTLVTCAAIGLLSLGRG